MCNPWHPVRSPPVLTRNGCRTLGSPCCPTPVPRLRRCVRRSAIYGDSYHPPQYFDVALSDHVPAWAGRADRDTLWCRFADGVVGRQRSYTQSLGCGAVHQLHCVVHHKRTLAFSMPDNWLQSAVSFIRRQIAYFVAGCDRHAAIVACTVIP